MKIINLGRGQGKTTRLLYASEFNNTPILCANIGHKEELIRMAKELNLYIPEPICVHELFLGKTRGNRDFDNGIFVDDAESVFQQMLNNIGCHSGIKAMTVTNNEDKRDNRFRDYMSSNRWL